MMRDMTWGAVLRDVTLLSDDSYVCFAQLPVSGDERVIITKEDDWGDDDENVPGAAAENGMTSCLAKGDLTQIVANLLQQDPSAAPEMLRRAVRYYYEHDAFVELDR